MLIPLKQGLKQTEIDYLGLVALSLNVDSIKTRIETQGLGLAKMYRCCLNVDSIKTRIETSLRRNLS